MRTTLALFATAAVLLVAAAVVDRTSGPRPRAPEPRPSFFGRCTDGVVTHRATDAPIAGARFVGRFGRSARSGDDGSFTVCGIDRDPQEVFVVAEGFYPSYVHLRAGRPNHVELMRNMRGAGGYEISGVGFGVESDGRIAHVAYGTPAERAGIRAGDVLLAVDGRSVGAIGAQFRSTVRGPPGTPVRLRVARDGWARDVTLVRERIFVAGD